jgi:O-antigen/teichoic acid export membrane protein
MAARAEISTRTQIPIGKGGEVTEPRLREPQTSVAVESMAETENPVRRASKQQKPIPWLMKGGLAMVDQGLVMGSNFVLTILLARWLSPEQYGGYALAFAALTLFLLLYQSLLLEPMLVFGGSAYRNCLRGYLKVLLLLHSGMSLVIIFVLCVSAGVAFKLGQADGLPGALVGVAFAAPSVFLFWLAKRMFYLKLSPAPSAGGALLSCAITIGGVTLVYKHGLLSPLLALLLMGLGSLGASVALLTYLGLRLPSSQDVPRLLDTWRQHWRYGRWALVANAMMWIPLNIFYTLLGSFSGMVQVGELKALMNFASPMFQAFSALSPLLLPYAARVVEERDGSRVSFVARRMTLAYVSCAVAYWVVLLLFKGPVFRILYSGRYTEVAYLLPVVALGSVFCCAFFGPATALRSMQSSYSVFAAVCVSNCISLAIGIPVTRALGIKGAVWSMALSEALGFVAAVALLHRKVRRFSQTPSTVPLLSASR